MGKIFKNMLPYWKWILVIVAFLVMQAFCDLSLPQYTSDIIDVGIMSSGVETMWDTDSRVQKAEIIINLRNRTNGRSWIAVRGLLVNGDRRGQPLDLLHIRLFHLP